MYRGQHKIEKSTRLGAVERSCVRAVTSWTREQQQQQQLFFSLSFLLNRPRHSPSNHVLHARAWCLRAGHRTQNLPGWIRTAQNWYFAKGRTTKPQTKMVFKTFNSKQNLGLIFWGEHTNSHFSKWHL